MKIVAWMAAWALSLSVCAAQPSTAPTGAAGATGTTPPSAPPPTSPPATTGATGPVGPAPGGTPPSQPPVTTGAPGLPTATGFVPRPQPVIKPTPGVPPNCQCVSVTIDGLTAKQQGQSVRTAVAGVAVDLEAIVKVQCSRPCQPGYTGQWHLTFVPGAQGDRFLVKPRTTARRGVQAVQEVRGEGAAGWYVPPGPGKLIVHWNGRAMCDGVVCEQRLSASMELDVVGAPSLSAAQKQAIVDDARARLPVIPGGEEMLEKDRQWRADLRASGENERADRVISPWAAAYDRAVGAWFGQATGWKPGDLYTQTFDMPGGCALLHGVEVTGTAFQWVANWAFGNEGLPCGFPAFTAMNVFGQSASGSVMAQRQGDSRGVLTLNLPVVDGFDVEFRYTDAAGERRTVRTRCAGTVGPRGEVNDPKSAPGPGGLRASICNVDASRLGGDDALVLGQVAKMVSAHFGGWHSYVNSEPAFDGLGNETQYTDVLIGGVHVPAAVIADVLKPLADALGAKIVVNGQNIVIQGADVPSREPVLPERLGGQRTR